jgi:hypothetical protein
MERTTNTPELKALAKAKREQLRRAVTLHGDDGAAARAAGCHAFEARAMRTRLKQLGAISELPTFPRNASRNPGRYANIDLFE